MKFFIYLRSQNSLKLFLWLALISTVASVPTSVLVQNSELASNAQQNHQNSNKNNNNNNNINNVMTKVKRSSGGNKNEAHLNNNNSPAAIMNKKSSPEIVPASYTAPPKPKSLMPQLQQQQQQQQRQEGNELNFNNNAMEKNNDLISSAIAAGLTAAAVEAAAVAANQHELEQLRKQHQLYADEGDDEQAPSAVINKRGISNQQYPYRSASLASSLPSSPNLGWGNVMGVNNDFNSGIYNSAGYYNPYGSFDNIPTVGNNDVPQGTWGDELDPGNVVYSDIDDYAPVSKASSYRNKAYDNLQNILNSESYLDTVPLPYNTGRYYSSGLDNDRSKRAYKIFNQLANKFPDMRLKRDTKLTPADMLALVALVEAGERARKDTDADAGYTYPSENYVPKTYGLNNNYNTAGNVYDYPSMPQVEDSLDYNSNNNGWYEPQSMVDYYGMPMNMDAMSKYEIPRELPRENKYTDGFAPMGINGNRYNNKRFMVAKKKRSIAKPSVPYKPETLF